MEKRKINFSDIKGMLSKDQMKLIKGGSANAACGTSCYIGNGAPGVCGYYNNDCACFGEGQIQYSIYCRHN